MPVESVNSSPKVLRDKKVHMSSKNSNIFPKMSMHAYRDPSEQFHTESQRSFGSRNSHYQDNLGGPSDDHSGSLEMMSRNKSKLSPSDLLAHKTAEENVRRLGAHKAINRGIFDRYTTESVLIAASSS